MGRDKYHQGGSSVRRRSEQIQRVGRYELLELLGVGGMAEVYRARPVAAEGPPCAIKRLRASRDEPRFRTLLIREGHLGIRIRHPNLVRCLGVESSEDGEPILVQELVLGADLRHLLDLLAQQGTVLPAWLSLHILAEVMDGLDCLHTEEPRLVHCDVTPENVLIGHDGRIKLADLGVATPSSSVAREPAKGKLTYMSPEQLSQEPIDGRSDVFSGGVVLWESLTGQQLFTGMTVPEVMAQVCAGQRVPPSRFAHEPLPPGVDILVLQALAVDVGRRPPSAVAFARRLRDLVQTYFGQVDEARVRDEVVALLRASPRPHEALRVAIESPVEGAAPSSASSDIHRTAPRLPAAKARPAQAADDDFWEAPTPGPDPEMDALLRSYLDDKSS